MMEHQICNLYCQPVTLVRVGVDGVADFFDSEIKKKQPQPLSNTETNTNLYNYHNDSNVFELYDELKPLGDEILKACNFVYQEILNHDSDLRITNAWFNECGINGGQALHNHVNSVLSGTVYLRTDENTQIEFLNRHIVSNVTNQIIDEPNQLKENSYGYYYHKKYATFSVREGDCMIWESYLRHGYTNNKTPNRLSLSFNLFPNNLNCLYKI